ncbi:hypothetical protein ACFY2W_30370 [Streptomyces sp. NPDC001262]|uniref:hypothetical protein n=1 Tax=Streptomyces sp. NPDC001262 TaxID=3364552 RepID=UPI0036BB7D28
MTLTDPFQQLQSALDLLDEQFFSPEPFTLRGCTQCYGEEDFEVLSGPVHLVPDDLVVATVLEVPSHWSDFPGLFRRMTPRILRAAVMDELHVFPDMLATRLLEAGWQQWPAPQRDAVTDLWHAWLRATLHRFPSTAPVGDAVRVIAASTGTLKPWLDIWSNTLTPAADQHLEDLVDDWNAEWGMEDLRLGAMDEYHATPELTAWLQGAVWNRLSHTQQDELSAMWRILAESATDG